MVAKLCCRGEWICDSWWCKLMEKWKGALAGECVPCLQGARQRWWELNLREGVSEPMGGGWTIGERVTLADSILRRIMALPHLTANCLRGYLCLCLQTSTELQTSTVKQSVWYPAAPRLAFIMLQSSASVLLPKGPRLKMAIFPLQRPGLIRYPHLKGVSPYWFLPPAKSLVNICLVRQRHYSTRTR